MILRASVSSFCALSSFKIMASGHYCTLSFGQRLLGEEPLNAPDNSTFFGGGTQSYTDYPRLCHGNSPPLRLNISEAFCHAVTAGRFFREL